MYMLSRSPFLLLIASETTLVLGLMFLFLFAAILSLVAAARIGTRESRNLVKCPSCAKLIKPEAINCPFCDQHLLVPVSPSQSDVADETVPPQPEAVDTEKIIVELPEQQLTPSPLTDQQPGGVIEESKTLMQVPRKNSGNSIFAGRVLGLVIILLIASQLLIFSRMNSLQERLDYVTALAENADRYAHTHSSYSDIRLKTNIEPLSDPLGGVLALQGAQFSWRSEEFPNLDLGKEPQFGLIAQEVQAVFPELVSVEPNGYLTVDYEKLTPILVEAIKEQQLLIENLQSRISKLEDSQE